MNVCYSVNRIYINPDNGKKYLDCMTMKSKREAIKYAESLLLGVNDIKIYVDRVQRERVYERQTN